MVSRKRVPRYLDISLLVGSIIRKCWFAPSIERSASSGISQPALCYLQFSKPAQGYRLSYGAHFYGRKKTSKRRSTRLLNRKSKQWLKRRSMRRGRRGKEGWQGIGGRSLLALTAVAKPCEKCPSAPVSARNGRAYQLTPRSSKKHFFFNEFVVLKWREDP